jgi:hypothetical protein
MIGGFGGIAGHGANGGITTRKKIYSGLRFVQVKSSGTLIIPGTKRFLTKFAHRNVRKPLLKCHTTA